MSDKEFEILGAQIANDLDNERAEASTLLDEYGQADVMGAAADAGKTDWAALIPGIFNATGEIVKFGVDADKKTKDAAAAAKDADVKANAAIAADVAWANAEVTLATANVGRKPQEILAAKSLAEMQQAAALQAGSGMSPAAHEKRVKAAHDMAAKARATAAGDLNSVGKQAAAAAWGKVASSALAQAAAANLPPVNLAAIQAAAAASQAAQGNFFTQKYGPLPMWGWLATGAVTLTGGILLIRALVKKK
ncbi:MAG: hypothetical protein Q7R30_23870 [Acidobacteriota bacterium]|nr:hypothetical protein [Acidobacteriota bacterium]